MSDTIKIVVSDLGKVSDGYHTMDELYEHRCLLFINLCLCYPDDCTYIKNHYDGWTLLVLGWANENQISYHVKNKYLPLFENKIYEDDGIYKWDGHTPDDVLKRLEKFQDNR